MIDWANVLASYWYPKLNTDIVDMTGQSAWPDDRTEEDIVRDSAFRNELAVKVRALPPSQMGFIGKDGWVFFTF